MKILFYIHGFSGGGAERVMATMANNYYQQGHSVCVGCDTSIVPAYDLESFSLQNIYNGCNSNKLTWHLRSYSFLRRLFNIRQIAKHEKPDVVISFMTNININVIIALIGLHIPIIVCEHQNVEKYTGIKNHIRSLVYPFASTVTVLTRRDYKLWKNKFKNVVYMPNPCDLPKDIVPQKKRENVILAAGGVDRWYHKGFDMLIKAWSNISKKHPDWELCIAGKASQESLSILSKIVQDFSKHNIKFLGFRDDVYSLMSSSSIFVLSSRFEGLPMVLIEAMNAGCCCISFDVETGPDEIITHNYNGILIPAEDIYSMQQWLSKLIEDSKLRITLASKAPDSMKKYSVDRIMGRWNILLSKVVEIK